MYNIKQAKQAIHNKWDWNDPSNNIPTFLFGPIGLGKTYIVYELAAERMIHELKKYEGPNKEKALEELHRLENYTNPYHVMDLLDRHVLSLRLNSRPIEQIIGIPAPKFETLSTVFLMPENMKRGYCELSGDWLIVFLDEIDKSDPVKLVAVTDLIESRRLGDWTLTKDTMLVCAANLPEHSFISNVIPPELRNRAACLELVVDVPCWVEWAMVNDVEESIIRFIEYKWKINPPQNFLAIYDTGQEATVNLAFPSPRSVVMASHQITKLKGKCTDKEIYEEVEQLVGSKFTGEYKVYYELYSKIHIEDVLSGKLRPPKFLTSQANDETLSKQYVFTFAMIDQLKAEHFSDPIAISNFCLAVGDLSGDIRTLLLKFLAQTDNNDIMTKLYAHPAGLNLVKTFLDRTQKIVKQ